MIDLKILKNKYLNTMSTTYMGVSKNRGTPKSPFLIGVSLIFTIHFGGFPLFFGSIHIRNSISPGWPQCESPARSSGSPSSRSLSWVGRRQGPSQRWSGKQSHKKVLDSEHFLIFFMGINCFTHIQFRDTPYGWNNWSPYFGVPLYGIWFTERIGDELFHPYSS